MVVDFFIREVSKKKSRSNCWHKICFSDVRSKVSFVAEWWNENYIELPTENSKHHPLEGIFWQRDVTFVVQCYNEQLTEWRATLICSSNGESLKMGALRKPDRTHVTLVKNTNKTLGKGPNLRAKNPSKKDGEKVWLVLEYRTSMKIT